MLGDDFSFLKFVIGYIIRKVDDCENMTLRDFLINHLYGQHKKGLKSKKEVVNTRHFFSPTIGFFVTSRCNFNCSHCILKTLNSDPTLIKDLPVSVFETALREGRRFGFGHVSLTGGEAILHPQFTELINLIKKYNYTYGFVSNGWFYKDYWRVIKHNKESLNYVTFSLDGSVAEIHDDIRGRKGSFNKVMEAISFYRKKQINIGVNFLVSKRNYHQIADTAKLCAGLGVKGIVYTSELPTSNSDLSSEERARALEEIYRLRKELKGSLNVTIGVTLEGFKCQTKIGSCPSFKGQRMVIDFNGGMFFCCNLYKRCESKPLIQDLGFKKAYQMNLELIDEFKKRRLNHAQTCDDCNNYIENYLNLVRTRYKN